MTFERVQPTDRPTPALPASRYVLTEALARAVNVALALREPLLVTGDPGVGKTMLAYEVGRQLGAEVLRFDTRSNSVGRDLLYRYDLVRRFHEAHVAGGNVTDHAAYISYEALGAAIQKPDCRVVLIDEIDKAPRDFPNDLLREIETLRFEVSEVPEPERRRFSFERAKDAEPLFVLITSNGERRLPDAFLRRCVYADIPFPDETQLRTILARQVPEMAKLGDSFGGFVLKRFDDVRRRVTEKKPCTAELVAWARVLVRMGATEAQLQPGEGKTLRDLPGIEALVKLRDDLATLQNQRR